MFFFTPVKAPVVGFSMDEGGAGEEEVEDSGLTNKVAAAKKVPPLIASKKTVNNINKWNQVQEELMQDMSGQNAPSATLAPPRATSSALSSNKTGASNSTTMTEVEFEFSDTAGLTCLLCSRQFKSLDQLKRHNKESDLHKARHFNAKNFKDPNLREVARQKVTARKVEEQPKYRDRASERRVLFNQPDVPLPEKDSINSKQKKSEGPPPPPSPPPSIDPGKDTNNVGNKLLKMMGWTEGTGLGSSGEGRVDPMFVAFIVFVVPLAYRCAPSSQTAIYAQGAGLGASKGKEIGKYADGYSGYVHMAQDAVSKTERRDSTHE
ncbi:hypothetical protein C0992_008889 [Termitomyces sp. T32_za158]|nr:hypothetical protein C0992_008889 [Termitomyces sp. T32_za158]